MIHKLAIHCHDRPVRIAVIGCGGTGSNFVNRLPLLHKSLVALGHPGLDVTVYDEDVVAEHNTVRQNFAQVDVGHNKAVVTVSRINVAHGLDWDGVPRRFVHAPYSYGSNPDFFVGCVDTKASRREIEKAVRSGYSPTYWIDLGNRQSDGQMVAGLGCNSPGRIPSRLPLVTELLPEIVQGEDEDGAPSCSAVQSLLRQGVATNVMAATLAFAWLSELLRSGQVKYCGSFFNLETGRVVPIECTPEAWASFGYEPQAA